MPGNRTLDSKLLAAIRKAKLPGISITSGQVVPDDADGADNDVYYLTDDGGITINTYQRVAGSWEQVGDASSPVIDGELHSYSPSIQSETGTITSVYDPQTYYRFIGNKMVHYFGGVSINNAGTGGGYLQVNAPFVPNFISGPCPAVGNSGVLLSGAWDLTGLIIRAANGTTAITSGGNYFFNGVYLMNSTHGYSPLPP